MSNNLEQSQIKLTSALLIIGGTISFTALVFWQVVIPIRDIQARMMEVQVELADHKTQTARNEEEHQKMYRIDEEQNHRLDILEKRGR